MKIKNIKLNIQKAFSLVEILIYLALFTVISIVVINSFIISMNSFSLINSNHDVLNSANNAMERMSREIRQAKSIDLTVSLPGQALQLKNSTGSVFVKFAKVDGLNTNALNVYKDGSATPEGNLLVSGVSVTNLLFKRISTVNSEAVKIEMTLVYNHGKIHKTEKFYDTIVLRKN